jgi:hypothetical protein
MRSTGEGVTVRLYHLDGEAEGGAATTLFMGLWLRLWPLQSASRSTCRTGCSSRRTMM